MVQKGTYRIRPLPISKIEVDRSVMTYRLNFGEKMWVPIYAWYIEGADRHILVDTGSDARLARDFRKLPAQDVQSFEDALGRLHLKPDDINMVIQTHLHWDHCSNTSKCRNAKVVVQEDELKFALAPHPVMLSVYIRSFLNGLRFVTVRGYSEILPGIELIPAPGHSPGTQAVAINTEKGKAIITGMCCTMANFQPPEEVRDTLPVIPPGIHVSSLDAFDSALKIHGLADILVPNHEPSFASVQSIP